MSDKAYAPTIHAHDPKFPTLAACGQTGNVRLTDLIDWSEVTCKKCFRTDAWHSYSYEEQVRSRKEKALTEEAVKKAVNEVFAKAREIADRAGYCSTYQEIEAEIIADLPYEIESPVREYEVEVEETVTVRIVRTITVEASSAEEAEEKADSQREAEERNSSLASDIYVEDGYVDSTEVTVESVSVSS